MPNLYTDHTIACKSDTTIIVRALWLAISPHGLDHRFIAQLFKHARANELRGNRRKGRCGRL
jgi:hypothetical protein